MSTITKQRFAAGFVFSFFLAIGFAVSLSIAGISSSEMEDTMVSKPQASTVIASITKDKPLDLSGLQVKK